jgi:hypothetical protein
LSPDANYAAEVTVSFSEALAIQAGGGTLQADVIRQVWNPMTRSYDDVGGESFPAIATWANANGVVLSDHCVNPLPPVEHLNCSSHMWSGDEVRPLTMLRSLTIGGGLLGTHDLEWIATLTKLERLDISLNKVRSVSALMGLSELRELDVSGNPVDAVSLEALLAARAFESLDVSGIDTTPGTWSSANLSRMRSLVVHGSSFSDADLRAVAERAELLHSLDLSHTQITGPGLQAAVPVLAGLKHLRLEGTEIDGHVAALAQLESLEALDLRFVHVTDKEIRALGSLVRLRSMKLRSVDTSCRAVADALERWRALERLMWMSTNLDCDPGLSKLPRLRELWLDDSGVHTIFFEDLGKCGSLERLSLQNTFVTDKQLEELARVTTLRRVLTHGTRVTSGGCDRLSESVGRHVCTGQ